MKISFTKAAAYLVVLATTTVLLSAGCGTDSEVTDKGPTYAELVIIYNQELETLDRLENKKKELIANHEQQLQPNAGDATKALNEILGSANELIREDNPEEVLDPEQALDRAVENAAKAQDVASQLLESVTQPAAAETEEDAAQRAEDSETFNRDLAALDGEIEKQKARVERARQARDAAEAE